RMYLLKTSEGTPNPATWPRWRGPLAYGQATADRTWLMGHQSRSGQPPLRPGCLGLCRYGVTRLLRSARRGLRSGGCRGGSAGRVSWVSGAGAGSEGWRLVLGTLVLLGTPWRVCCWGLLLSPVGRALALGLALSLARPGLVLVVQVEDLFGGGVAGGSAAA